MGINATLFGQMITFGIFVWIMMKFIWPPLRQAMDERRQQISDGLAAAKSGTEQLDKAKQDADKILREARQQALEIVSQANKRSTEIVGQAQVDAKAEGERLVAAAGEKIDQEVRRAKEQIRGEVADLAMAGARQILSREIDATAHKDILDRLVSSL